MNINQERKTVIQPMMARDYYNYLFKNKHYTQNHSVLEVRYGACVLINELPYIQLFEITPGKET